MSGVEVWHWVTGKASIFYTRTRTIRRAGKVIVARAEIIATEAGPSHKIRYSLTFAAQDGTIQEVLGSARSSARNGLAGAKKLATDKIEERVESIVKNKLEGACRRRLTIKVKRGEKSTVGHERLSESAES